jgi:hypothetical protein
MLNRIKFFPVVIAISVLSILFACRPQSPNRGKGGEQALTLDTFSTLPPEIDGCGCYFSNDQPQFENHTYIYVNDFAKTSFVKINGEMVKFTLESFKETGEKTTQSIYKSDRHEMILDIKDGEPMGEEAMLKSGTITITDKSGQKITRTFYGECGC